MLENFQSSKNFRPFSGNFQHVSRHFLTLNEDEFNLVLSYANFFQQVSKNIII